jgi:N-acetylglutamate synthase-like GNAT family acetyltransferase
LTSGSKVKIRHAVAEDIDAIKELADAHRHELGFLRRPALLEAIQRQELLVAQNSKDILGFVEYRHRRDQQTTLYNVVVHPDHLRQGIGRDLVFALEKEAQQKEKFWILLKCPEDLPANNFYQHIGYKKVSIEQGKSRQLNIWRKTLGS